ncbi:MAG: DUF4097 family beta strand repeat-containing protein [Clostridium sp.]
MKMGILSMILVGAFALTMGGCISIGVKDRSYNEINESYISNDVKKIDIDGKSIDLVIKDGTSDKIVVTGNAEGDFKGEISNGTLTIDISGNQSVIFGISNRPTELTVEVPRNLKTALDLDFGAGDVKINNLKFNELVIKGGAGDVEINDVDFDYLNFKGGAGNLTMNVSTLGRMNIKAGVGDIDITGRDKIAGDVDIKGGVGDIDLRIPEKSPIKFNTDNGIGGTNIKSKTNGEEKYVYKIKSGIGQIEIK